MEKDKGIFSFGKHPVGELPGGKKERKRKESWLRGENARKMHRALGVLLAAALIFNTLPASGFAVSASEQEKGLCKHHPEHTAQCGYQEAQDCGYVCEICNGTEPENTENNAENDTENAGTDTAECICETLCTEDSINGDCPVCGAEDADLSHCKGEKTEEQEKTGEKVITAWEWIDPEEYLTDGMLALPGAGRENPAFAEDVTALLPEKIQAKVAAVDVAEDGEETEEDAETAPETEDAEITLTGWECASYPEDGAYEGVYIFTAFLPEGFVLAEDTAGLEVKVELGGAEMLAETVSVSYQEASWNGSEVTYTGKTENCTSVESSTEAVTWDAGWYVVNSTVTISEPITVTGAVNLILADGCTLNAEKGIVVTTDNSLTIYAQSGSGTLNATGTTDSSNNASAGIGGSTSSFDSGTTTIHGGVINAIGGVSSFKIGAAGIGGGTVGNGNGGSSGTIIIYGGTVTANSGEGNVTGAGIGGGASGNNSNGGAGSNITIYGGSVTAASTGIQSGGAGIGGGGGFTGGGAGSNIQIYGGTINATGSEGGAGIGGGSSGVIENSSYKSGDGAVTISGGIVTAVGGTNAAGIGGGGGYYSSYTLGDTTFGSGCTGGTGSVTISGGIVDAKGGAGNSSGDYAGAPIGNGGNTTATATVNKTTGIVFENGAGTVCGDVTLDGSYTVPGDYTLNIPVGASLSGSGTLSGGNAFTTENLTADMISVPTDLYYDGKDRTADITTKLSGELTKGVTICGQTFTVGGWTLAVEKTGDLTYTATYTNNNDNTNTFTKTITLLKSGTKFEGDVKTYNGDTQTTTFNADDTITVKATPTATGTAPQKAAARLRSDYTASTEGQMALFVGDVQVSEPVQAGEGGTYTMTVSAAEVLLQGNAEQNGNAVTLTAKFVGNDNMADGTGTATVNITAVAVAEKDGKVIGYYGESNLDDAFTNDSATVTLLANVERTNTLTIKVNCTLDLGGHNITFTGTENVWVQGLVTAMTIRGEGEIISEQSHALVVTGSVTLEGGTFTSRAGGCAGVRISSADAQLIVTNEHVVMRNTSSGGYGLAVNSAQSVQLSAGTYSSIAVASPHTLASLLVAGYAYYKDGSPIPLSELADQKELTGTVTVQECQHKDVTPTANNDGTHTLRCPYCGYTKTAENCDYGEYTHNDTSHTRICKLCGYQNVEAHNIKCTAEASGTVIAVSEACETCGYGKDLGTVTIHIPKLVYGDLTGVVTAENTLTEPVSVAGNVKNPLGETIIFSDHATIGPPTMATLTGDALLSAGEHKIKINIVIIRDENALAECELTFNVDPAPLTADMVTLSAESATYSGTEQKPALSVRQGQTALTEGTNYEVSYTRDGVVTNDFTSAGTVKITVTGKGNYAGTVTREYAISKADVPAGNLIYTEPADLVYTGRLKTAIVTANNLTGIGAITVKYKKDNSGDLLTEVKEPGTYHVYADISAGQNYNAAQIKMGSFTISYMAAPAVLYNGREKKDWYNEDVAISAGSAGYTVSDAVDGDYKSTYHISAQEGTVAKTLYFMNAPGHISEGVDVEVNFDLTPPTGEIAVGAKWWQNFLHVISFGNYAAKEYTVTIKAEDKNGSGISKIEYAIVTGADQYTDADALEAANPDWKKYDNGSKPTVPVSNSQYVVYARLTDNAGNVTYISTDGILLDDTPPTVGNLSVPEDTKKDVTAGVAFTVSEAADYYYVVLPESGDAPSAEDIIVTCGGTLPDGKMGTAISGTVDSGKGATAGNTLPASVSVEAKNLQPYTAYSVYVTAVDRALDITDSAEGKPAGNIADAVNAGFTTKKTLPVITKTPAVAGTYGQSVGEMTVTGGTAQAGSTVLAGTWTVSDADKNKKPSAGTAEVTVIFKPESDNYDSVSVQSSLTVSQKGLDADGVTVSEAAGTYTYTGSEIKPLVEVNTGMPASGIYISDSGADLTANDFTVSYSNNKDAGTASITITGRGNYTGSVTRTFTIAKAPGREVPEPGGNMAVDNETGTYTYTVTPTDGAVYRMGDVGAWTTANEFKGVKPGTSVTFYAKMPETGNYKDGTPKSITVDFPRLTPAAPALSYTRQTETGTGEITITITPAEGAEYSFDGGTTWQSGEGANVQGGFTTSGTVALAIRLKETETHNQSPVQTVTVDLAKEDREAPPAFRLSVEANGETDYTVTIPPTEGCEYSFDGAAWSEINGKTGVSVGEIVTGYKRYKETEDYNAGSAVSAKEIMPKFTVKTPVISPAGGSYSGSVSVTVTCGSPDAEIYYTTDGSTPGRGSARYTGAFAVSVPATVKAVAIKDGLNDSDVATVSYAKKSGGGSGGSGGSGNSGGKENNSGQDSVGNDIINPGNGNTFLQTPATKTADKGRGPGTGTAPTKPEGGTAAGPGTAPDSGADRSAEGTGQPFIKGEDGKTGWDVIRAEEEKAEEGSVINVDMNGSAVVPGDIFDSIKGKDITITFDMGNGILWSVDGKSITADRTGDIDFSVKTGADTVPVDIVNNVTGERYSIQISLSYEGEFGFTAVLSIGLGRENAGYSASLYYYNESTGGLEFICSDEVAEDGTVSLAFTHASDYVIAIDGEEENSSAGEPAQPGDQDGDSAGRARRTWWLIAVGALVIVMGIGVFFVGKKEKDEDSGQ